MIEIRGLPEIQTVTPISSTTGRSTKHAPPIFPDALASMKVWSLAGLIPRFCAFLYQTICSFLPYPIHKKTPLQVVTDFNQSPSRVFLAFLKYYQRDEDGAESLLLEVAKIWKKNAPSDRRVLVSNVNEVIAKMVFSKSIIAIQDDLIMATATWEDTQKFQEVEKKFNGFLKRILLKVTEREEFSEIRKKLPSEMELSFGEFLRILADNSLVERLRYAGNFRKSCKLVNQIIVEILTLQEGKKVLIEDYPRLKVLMKPIRDLLNDSFLKQRLWTTIVRLVVLYERES